MKRTNTTKCERRAAMAKRVQPRIAGIPVEFGSRLNSPAWSDVSEAGRFWTWRRVLEIRDGIAQFLGLPKGALDEDGTLADAELELDRRRVLIEQLKPFDEMARKSDTTLAAALKNYTEMEALWRSDPVAGFSVVCLNMGKNPLAVIEEISANMRAAKAAQQMGAI